MNTNKQWMGAPIFGISYMKPMNIDGERYALAWCCGWVQSNEWFNKDIHLQQRQQLDREQKDIPLKDLDQIREGSD